MKNAIIFTQVISIHCPNCDETMTNENGSSMFEGSQVTLGSVVTCNHCNTKIRIPKTITLA